MTEAQIKALLAGVPFGIWPLFMNRSQLNGSISSVFYCAVSLITILPFALYSSGLVWPSAHWTMVLLAGVFGALGLLAFNSMLATVSPKEVGTLFVLMTVMQIVVASGYQAVMSGGIPLSKAVGYVTAIISAILLLR